MKKLFVVLFFSAALWGCSSSVNTANMSAQDHLNYAISLFNDEDYLEAITEFQTILMQNPGSPVADDAQFYLGESHYKKGEYITATYEYSKLIRDMPASEFVPRAQFMLAQAYYDLSPNFQLDQRYTKKAIEEFQAFIDFFPTDPKVSEAEQKINDLNGKLAEKEYNTARIYEKMEYWDAAIRYYDLVSETYHDTKYAPMAMYSKIKILNDRKDNKKLAREIASFIQRYPGDPHISEVKKIQQSL